LQKSFSTSDILAAPELAGDENNAKSVFTL
jgi:hypothetical protein